MLINLYFNRQRMDNSINSFLLVEFKEMILRNVIAVQNSLFFV